MEQGFSPASESSWKKRLQPLRDFATSGAEAPNPFELSYASLKACSTLLSVGQTGLNVSFGLPHFLLLLFLLDLDFLVAQFLFQFAHFLL